jgi:hypothetical protein
MRIPSLIVFAFSCLSTIGAANALLPASLAQSISSPQGLQIAQQGPVKAKPAQRQRQNPRHKTPVSERGKPTSVPESDDVQPRLAPGS